MLLALAGAGLPLLMRLIAMPGRPHSGPLPSLTSEERALADQLAGHVRHLAGEIGERHVWRFDGLQAASQYIQRRVRDLGYATSVQQIDSGGRRVDNVAAERRGVVNPEEIVVVGAHYDSVTGCPGANDNGTGVAALLELSVAFSGAALGRTLRFVAFANEEPPFFRTPEMGSLHYARAARARGERIVAMLSLETIGAYSDSPGSQRYPLPLFGIFYPREANFIAFVGNFRSRALVRRAVGTFRRCAVFPSEGMAAPAWIAGIGWSDHWAFWQHGYPAIMITDTALFRYPPYHTAEDTPDKIAYDRMARVVSGLQHVVGDLAGMLESGSHRHRAARRAEL